MRAIVKSSKTYGCAPSLRAENYMMPERCKSNLLNTAKGTLPRRWGPQWVPNVHDAGALHEKLAENSQRTLPHRWGPQWVA